MAKKSFILYVNERFQLNDNSHKYLISLNFTKSGNIEHRRQYFWNSELETTVKINF